MKVSIQNGAVPELRRREIESIIPLLPIAWSKLVDEIVLYQGTNSAMLAYYYPTRRRGKKKRILGLFWPNPPSIASKEQGIEELLLALSVLNERGELPYRLSPATRRRHLAELEQLFKKSCNSVFGGEKKA